MRLLARLRKLLGRDTVPPELAGMGVTEEQMKLLRTKFEAEINVPPRIAILGETGVGKTSTVNALFNKGFPISHERACTKSATEFMTEIEILDGEGDPVTIIDLPGVGEDLEADEAHFAAYADVLPTADVAVWIVKADNRALSNVQSAIKRLITEKSLDPKRLVFAMNQIDQLQPGTWDADINQPSPEQKKTIVARRKDVADKMKRVVSLSDDHIVEYSALKRYNLPRLLRAMLEACDERRRWMLYDRSDCASFLSLIEEAPQSPEGEGVSHAE